jgi:hypothetical protein
VPYHECVIPVQQVILTFLERLLFNLASKQAEAVADDVCVVLAAGDLEPTEFAVVGELGLGLYTG